MFEVRCFLNFELSTQNIEPRTAKFVSRASRMRGLSPELTPI